MNPRAIEVTLDLAFAVVFEFVAATFSWAPLTLTLLW
jgi:hypothetical protein